MGRKEVIKLHVHKPVFADVHGRIDLYSGDKLLTTSDGVCRFGILYVLDKFRESTMPRLSNENRNRILGLLDAGVSQNEVSRRFNVARSTIVRLIQRVRQTGTVADRPRPGNRRVMSRRQDNICVNVT